MMLRSASAVRRPVVSASRRYKATLAGMEDGFAMDEKPTLVKVPKLPFAGSMYQPYSKLPVPFELERSFEFWPAMREKFGTFYEFGFPGIGTGLTGTCYIIQDPSEMASILRQEGEYPHGAVEFTWAFGRFLKERKFGVAGLLSHGPEWKRMRRFIQSDLLSPAAGARYVPAILEAAEVASRGAPHYTDNLNEYLNLASFDMFSNAIMGHVPKVSDPTSATEPEDVEFCRNVAEALRIGSSFSLDGFSQAFLNMGLGMKTKKYKEFEERFDKAINFGRRKVQELYQRRLDGTLTEKEKNSYCNMAYDRQAANLQDEKVKQEEIVHLEEVDTIIGALLAAGVDTTGGMLSFKLLHLASSPEVQDKLYHDLQPTLVNGKLTRESLVVPYLSQILRESHRCANSADTVPMKALPVAREVHGHPLPKGAVILLDGYSTGRQQEHFVDPIQDFVPERFSAESVQARKGTRHQVVDHAFFSGPFSQGARKCPGSRVANLEAHALLAQWVLDWKMELPSHISHFTEVPYGLQTVTTAKLPTIHFTPRQK